MYEYDDRMVASQLGLGTFQALYIFPCKVIIDSEDVDIRNALLYALRGAVISWSRLLGLCKFFSPKRIWPSLDLDRQDAERLIRSRISRNIVAVHQI